MEFKPDNFPFSFPAVKDSVYGDSVVLVLAHTKTFGDSTVSQKVNVFQLSPNSFKDSVYTSCYTFPYNNSSLGSLVFLPNHLKDTSKNFGDTSINELRIKLSSDFARYLFSQDQTNLYKNDSIYRYNFPGLAIIPDGNFGGNALNYFNLDNGNTKLALYFHYIKNGKSDTTVTYFRFNNLTGEANPITRNRSGADIVNHLSHNPVGDEVVYIQTSPGSFANIRIPDLSGLSNRIIHKAEIIMESLPILPSDPFAAPDFLYLQVKDSSLNGAYHPVPCDFIVSNNTPNIGAFGGVKTFAKDASGNTTNKYIFNITRYVQNFVTFKRSDINLQVLAPTHVSNHLFLFDYCNQSTLPFNFLLNANAYGRVILGGGNNSAHKMTLRIIYSRI